MSTARGGESGVLNTTAKLRFLVDQLPKSHRANFQSCLTDTQLLDAAKQLNAFKWGTKRIERLTSFIDCVKPFLKALDVLSQLDPVHFGAVWGGIRVMLQLAENFTTFLDKFTQSLDDLAREIEFFNEVDKSIESLELSERQRMAVILESVLEDLLLYLTEVMRIFHKGDGSAKSKARVFANTVWKPFRFDYIVERIKSHRSALRDEAMLYDLRERRTSVLNAQEHRHKTESRDNIRRIQAWLAPPAFTDRYDEARRLRLPETSMWIFDHDIYKSWLDQSLHPELVHEEIASLICIYGKPGSGKTVLAAAVTDDLKAEFPADICYFFFNSLRHQPNDSTAAFRSILAQILQRKQKDERLIELFLFAMDVGSDGQLTASRREIDELMDLCCQLPSIQRLFLVLDGLDECDHEDFESEVVPKLRKLGSMPHTKLVLFGRETIRTQMKQLDGLRILQIGSHNLEDIRRLLCEELGLLLENGHLPRGLDLEECASRLARRADGMFLWARLMVSFLKCRALSISERVTAISEVDSPEGLETMYERILHVIARGGTRGLHLASQVFLWLSHGLRGLTAKELQEAVFPGNGNAFDQPSNIAAFSDTVIEACGGFVEQPSYHGEPSASDDFLFRFIHASVKEYFGKEAIRSRLQSGAQVLRGVQLFHDAVPANISLATRCLEYLTYTVPAQPLSATFGSKRCGPNLELAFPLSRYAVLYWPTHLLHTEASHTQHDDESSQPHVSKEEYSRLISALQVFVSQSKVLTAWIETSYIFDKPPRFEHLRAWASKISNTCRQSSRIDIGLVPEVLALAGRVEAFASHLGDIIATWNSHLSDDPGCAWQEVIAYSNSDFLAKNPGISVKQLASDIPLGATLAAEPVSKISRLISDGTHDVVLAIYPTRAFLDCYSMPRLHSLLFRHIDHSTGWVARLEIFDVRGAVSIFTKDIPLEPSEVLLHLYQTLLGGSVQFPLAISPDGRHIAILRTVYSFITDTDAGSQISYVSGVIPLPENDTNRGFWTLPKQDATGYALDDHVRMRRSDMERIFLYWIFFDHHGRDLCVAEYTRGHPHVFSVFQLPRVNRGSSSLELTLMAQRCCSLQHPYLLRAREESCNSQDVRNFELAFHPLHPAVAVAGETGTYIWNYSVGVNNKLIRIGGGIALSWSQATEGNSVEPLSFDLFVFSEDGKFLVTKTSNSLPSVLDITSYLLGSDVLARDSEPRGDKGFKAESAGTGGSLAELISLALGKPSAGPENVLARNGLFTVGGRTAGILTASKGKAVTLEPFLTDSERSRGGPAPEPGLTLTRLPNLGGASAVNPSILSPRETGEPMKIVLDQMARNRNKLNQPGGHHAGVPSFPLILERDITTLPQIGQLHAELSNQNTILGKDTLSGSRATQEVTPDHDTNTATRLTSLPRSEDTSLTTPGSNDPTYVDSETQP